jgi:alpha-glucosidase
VRTRLGGSEARARAALVMLLTLRGTPFLFAGEELGLEDAEVPPERVVDPGGRDGCRAPIPWTTAADHGWPAEPWLPWPPEPGARSVEAQRADPASMLHLARAVLALRRESAALHRGELELLDDAPDGVLAYERSAGDDRRRVWVNFAGAATALPEGWAVELATADTAGGELPPDAAALLRPC